MAEPCCCMKVLHAASLAPPCPRSIRCPLYHVPEPFSSLELRASNFLVSSTLTADDTRARPPCSRPQETCTRLGICFRAKEGKGGQLQAFIIPNTQPPTCQARSCLLVEASPFAFACSCCGRCCTFYCQRRCACAIHSSPRRLVDHVLRSSGHMNAKQPTSSVPSAVCRAPAEVVAHHVQAKSNIQAAPQVVTHWLKHTLINDPIPCFYYLQLQLPPAGCDPLAEAAVPARAHPGAGRGAALERAGRGGCVLARPDLLSYLLL